MCKCKEEKELENIEIAALQQRLAELTKQADKAIKPGNSGYKRLKDVAVAIIIYSLFVIFIAALPK